MEILPPTKIKVVNNIENKGRGVVATEDIAKDEIIECAPIIPLGKADYEHLKSQASDTLKYYFLDQYDLDRYAIMLGYASLYNHDLDPNAELDYEEDHEKKFIIMKAIKDIKAGEEITWDYCFDNDIIEFMPSK